MAAAGDDSTGQTGEREVAEMWQKACPTLSTIILPNGIVWFCKSGTEGTHLLVEHLLDEGEM